MNPLRRRILDASLALVAEQGVRAVSFREVARRAGVSHQTPYHHFGDHRGILQAIAEEGFEALRSSMAEAAEAAGPEPLAALKASGLAYVAFAQGHVGHFRVMFQRHLSGAEPGQEGLGPRAETYALLMRLAGAVEARQGPLPWPPGALGHMAWATVHGLATLSVEGALEGPPPGSEAPPRPSPEALAQSVLSALSALLDRGSKGPGPRAEKAKCPVGGPSP